MSASHIELFSFYYVDDEINPIRFDVLASLIRMGHKYGIPSVLNDALARLKKFYPTDLAAWLDTAARARSLPTP